MLHTAKSYLAQQAGLLARRGPRFPGGEDVHSGAFSFNESQEIAR
jgi:hypothetical protein